MIIQTTKYLCDRCRKQMDNRGYLKHCLHLAKTSKILIRRWNGDDGCYERVDLCKECAESFNNWWDNNE